MFIDCSELKSVWFIVFRVQWKISKKLSNPRSISFVPWFLWLFPPVYSCLRLRIGNEVESLHRWKGLLLVSYQNRCWCNTLFSVTNRSGLFRKFHRNPVGDQIYGMDAPYEIVFFRIDVLKDNGTKIYRWSHSRWTLLRINTDNWLTGKGLIVVISVWILLFGTGFVPISSQFLLLSWLS